MEMFSKLPQRFTAPFGLLGDEAKLAFPSQANGIHKLFGVRNISASDTYWEQYFVLFDSASEVFSLITSNHIRRALVEAPENVVTLVRVVSSRLFNLISDHTFPTPANDSVTAYASSLMKSAGMAKGKNTTQEVLNCLRVLERVLPVIFELQGETNMFEMDLLWKREEVEETEASATQESQFVIEDEDEDEDEGDRTQQQTPTQGSTPAPKLKQLPALAERLISAAIDLLFCCGFTLPKNIQVDHHKINYVIWEKGVGSTASLGNGSFENNKTEVLRFLLVLLSRQIYVAPSNLFSKPSPYSLYITQSLQRRDVLTILCSLLNTAMNSSVTDTITIGTIAGKLPYNHLVFKGEDPRTNLIMTCLQVLCVLLDFQSGSAKDPETAENEPAAPTLKTNAFRYFVMKLHRTQDFEYILNGVLGILEQQMAAIRSPLPGAKKSLPYITETIILLWKFVELNKKFCQYILESENAMDIIAYLLCYAVEVKDKPQQHGVVRAISYIVQSLSAEPCFGIRLNSPLKASLPVKWGPVDSAAEFIIHAVYAIIATTSGTLNSLYPALIIALSNAAAHFKNIGVTASARLIQLFTSFSNPLFLLSDEGHPRLLFFMLEVFTSVIYHHVAENPNITYGILQSRRAFEDLGTFTLTRGLREVRRVQLAKEERAKKGHPDIKGKAVEDLELGDPGSEKAKLLENETASRRSSQDQDIEAGVSPRQSQGDEPVTASFMSPTSDMPYGEPLSPLSEKARGKMRERRSLSMSIDTLSALDRVPLPIGRNGFVPTQEWVTSWQQGLPLDIIMLFISDVIQKVEEMQRHRTVPSSEVISFLSRVNLDHVLPNKPPISPRRFIWSDASHIWLTSLIWGEIYVHGITPLGIWNSTNVRLFFVKHTQPQQRQITNTVTSVVGGFLRRTSDSPQNRQVS